MEENKINNSQEQENKKNKKGIKEWWFNLGKGVRIAIYILGAGVIATAITVPIVVCNQTKNYDVSVDDIDKLDYKNKGFDKDGNVLLYVKPKSTENLESLTISVGNYVLIEGTDYTYNASTGNLVIYKKIITEHPGKLNIKPTFLSTVVSFSLSQKSITTCTNDTQTVEIVYDDWRYSKNVKSIDWVFSDPTKVSDITYNDNKNAITFKTINTTEGTGITLTAKVTSKKDILTTSVCNIKIDNTDTFTLSFIAFKYEIKSTTKAIAQNENIRITCSDIGYDGFYDLWMTVDSNEYTFSTDDSKDIKITKILVNDTNELIIGQEGVADAYIKDDIDLMFKEGIFHSGDKLTIEATVKKSEGISIGSNISLAPNLTLANAEWDATKECYGFDYDFLYEKDSILSLYSEKQSGHPFKTIEFVDHETSTPFSIGYRDSSKDISILDVYCNSTTKLKIGDKNTGDYWIEDGKLKLNSNVVCEDGKNLYVNTKVFKEGGVKLNYTVKGA